MNTIHHIAIICSDKEAALHFYHDLLGFSIIRENYRPERDDWKIDLRINDATELELFIMKERVEAAAGSSTNNTQPTERLSKSWIVAWWAL